MKHALFVAALFVAGCTQGIDQKFDGSSEAAYRISLGKMRGASKPEEVKAIDDAIRVLAITDVAIGFEGGILGAMAKMRDKTAESLAELVLPQVNGKTGREVIAAANARKQEQAKRQLAAETAEMAALRKARTDKDGAREFLSKIQVLEPRLGFSGGMAILDFKVQNGTEEALSSLLLRATVTGAGGGVVMTDEFTYRASPPIAPAQTRDVRLPSSTPGKWSSPQLANQTEISLKLAVENASTSSGAKLAASFTQKDAERLALLEKQKPELEALAAAK
jgi:hypothetical protein